MRFAMSRPSSPRRGFTLLEMLVVVALVVLMMTIFVSIFAAATGAITVSRKLQGLDQSLRNIDGTIRRDLAGITARLTPPLNPDNNLGYFEYGENAFADAQGEDTDDYIRFTAQAPEGQPFVGRVVLPVFTTPPVVPPVVQNITVTSDFAEIIYFVRDGNLYRRVLLVAPNRVDTLMTGNINNPNFGAPLGTPLYDFVSGFGFPVSWLGLNDISARPSKYSAQIGTLQPPTPNTLGDLTNRENRAFMPRVSDDYYNAATATVGVPTDGVTDDRGPGTGNPPDGVPDYYPTLYPNVFNVSNVFGPLVAATANSTNTPRVGYTYDIMPFPYVFPGMYSKADVLGGIQIHSLDPTGTTFNQGPLELGDSLPIPTAANQLQTWWGFPTWRETMSPNWLDPIRPVNFDGTLLQSPGLSFPGTTNYDLLPPVPGPFSDNLGNSSATTGFALPLPAGLQVWQDDLILTGVRSFDVKALDTNARVWSPVTTSYVALPNAYYDLGYEASYFPYATYPALATGTPAGLLPSFAHEGRIPPATGDNRVDPQAPQLYNATTNTYVANNIGDDGATVIRLRRVFDTWSTDYTNVPNSTLVPSIGPPFVQPVYPSYPPPYPAPLRGIQIQIRVVDPSNEHIRVLTIRQDFTDKL